MFFWPLARARTLVFRATLDAARKKFNAIGSFVDVVVVVGGGGGGDAGGRIATCRSYLYTCPSVIL